MTYFPPELTQMAQGILPSQNLAWRIQSFEAIETSLFFLSAALAAAQRLGCGYTVTVKDFFGKHRQHVGQLLQNLTVNVVKQKETWKLLWNFKTRCSNFVTTWQDITKRGARFGDM